MFESEIKMFPNIYQVIWNLLQLVFNIVDIFRRIGSCTKRNYKIVLRKLRGEDFSYEKMLIEKNKKNLTKIPMHLAVILGMELPDFEVLSKVIFWCLSAGIPNISFYDHQGVLVENNHKIYDFLSQWKKDKDRICWNSTARDVCSGQIVYKNGMSKELSVNFLSPRESKLKIAEICRSLAGEEYLEPQQIDINTINKKCSAIINPDPDLAIYFGEVCSTYGFLPWHIRLTEFFPIESQRVLTVNAFLNTLFKFSKCEQRFGC